MHRLDQFCGLKSSPSPVAKPNRWERTVYEHQRQNMAGNDQARLTGWSGLDASSNLRSRQVLAPIEGPQVSPAPSSTRLITVQSILERAALARTHARERSLPGPE